MKFVIKEKKIQNNTKVIFVKRKNIFQIKDKSNKSNITKNEKWILYFYRNYWKKQKVKFQKCLK